MYPTVLLQTALPLTPLAPVPAGILDLDPALLDALTAAVQEESVSAYRAGFTDGLRAASSRGLAEEPDVPPDRASWPDDDAATVGAIGRDVAFGVAVAGDAPSGRPTPDDRSGERTEP